MNGVSLSEQLPSNWSDLMDAVYQQMAFKAHATRKLAGKIKWNGLDISLEHLPGDVRRGVDKKGRTWETTMKSGYRYLLGTQGQDGDHLDCFVDLGRVADSEGAIDSSIHILHIIDPDTGEYDEDKCYIGFASCQDVLEHFADDQDCQVITSPRTEIPLTPLQAHLQHVAKH